MSRDIRCASSGLNFNTLGYDFKTPQILRSGAVYKNRFNPIFKSYVKSPELENREYSSCLNLKMNLDNEQLENFDKFSSTSSLSLSNQDDSSSLFTIKSNDLESSKVSSINSFLAISSAVSLDDSPSKEIGVTIFNYNPVKGMKYLLKNEFLPWDPEIIAIELKKSCYSSQAVGEFLGSSDPLALPTLEQTIKSIEMSNLNVDEALRRMLWLFYPNGESQKISSLLMIFAKHYRASNPQCMIDIDCIHTLSYAIIMLHTDHFNPSANRHYPQMTCAQFIKNLSDMKSMKISAQYLERIYNRVTKKEFEVRPDYTKTMRDLDKILVGPLKSSKFLLRHRRLINAINPVNEVFFETGRRTMKPNHTNRRLLIFNDFIILAKEIRERQSLSNLKLHRKSLTPSLTGSCISLNQTQIPNTTHTIKKIIRLKDLIMIPCSSSNDKFCLELITADKQKHQISFDSEAARESAIESIKKGIREINQLSTFQN